MRLPCRVAFVDTKKQSEFETLRNSDTSGRKLFAQLVAALERIETNAFAGIQIPKRLIPDYYLRQHPLRNLWKYDLAGGSRLLYSVEHQDQGVVAIVVEWLDHKEYERRFKY